MSFVAIKSVRVGFKEGAFKRYSFLVTLYQWTAFLSAIF